MTLNTGQVLEQKPGWDMRCHYVMLYSPFLSLYSLFKVFFIPAVYESQKKRTIQSTKNHILGYFMLVDHEKSVSWVI